MNSFSEKMFGSFEEKSEDRKQKSEDRKLIFKSLQEENA